MSRADMGVLEAVAPAKLNLALHITGKREDGYHLFESLVAFTDIGDVVRVEPADVLSLRVGGPFAMQAGDVAHNHVLRAAQMLQRQLGISSGARISLDKQLPVGAGLGGGSSDAAVAVRLLLRLWGHIVPEDVLMNWLLPLGADMPMCLVARPLIARGIGEQVQVLARFPALYAVLCWPGILLPTPAVYRAYRDDGRRLALEADTASAPALLASLAPSRNVLQQAAIACAPEVAEALLALSHLPHLPFVRMSGSGACCVAYFDDEGNATSAAASMAQRYPHWWVRQAQIPAC